MSKSTHFPVIPIEQVPAAALEIVPQPSSGTLPPANPPVVLVVDDEHTIADTMSLIFASNGFAVFTAYNAAEALEMAALVPPELLISDVVMPGMSGVDLAIEIRRAIPDCEVILFSGQASTVDLLKSAKTAGHEFTLIPKPVHPTVMLDHASELLRIPRPHHKLPIPTPGPSMVQRIS